MNGACDNCERFVGFLYPTRRTPSITWYVCRQCKDELEQKYQEDFFPDDPEINTEKTHAVN